MFSGFLERWHLFLIEWLFLDTEVTVVFNKLIALLVNKIYYIIIYLTSKLTSKKAVISRVMTIVDWTLIFVEYYYDDYWVLLDNAMGVSIRVMPVDGSTLTYVHGPRLIIVVD